MMKNERSRLNKLTRLEKELGRFNLYVDIPDKKKGLIVAWIGSVEFEEDAQMFPTFDLTYLIFEAIDCHTNSSGKISEQAAKNIYKMCDSIRKYVDQYNISAEIGII